MSCNKPLCSTKTDDDDPLALLASLGVGIGEAGAAHAAPYCSAGLSSAPDMQPPAASDMAQTQTEQRMMVSNWTLAPLEL